MIASRLIPCGLAFLAFGVASCSKSDGRKPTFAVTGQVLDGIKPVANATVVFHPVGDADPSAVRPRGVTRADGTFTLTTYDGNDGAPVGGYRVTVEQWLAGKRTDDGPANRLPPKFSNPASSGLTATVNAMPTELGPINLKK